MRGLAITALGAFLIDQISKWAILYVLELPAIGFYPVYPPFLQFSMAWNYGINFGLFAQESDVTRWVLVGLSCAVSAFVVGWAYRQQLGLWARLCAGLLIGGALGNALDRVIHGAVVDFLNMSCCGINNPYAFNVADIFIFAGAIGLAFFGDPKKDG